MLARRERQTIKPRRLEAGDGIGIISPAGPLNAQRLERLDRALNYLRQRGFRIFEGQHVREQTGYLAGLDEQRAQDFNDMFANPDVRAVFCSRGGYGITRLLDKIDYDLVQQHPKILVGYSDVTALSLALYEKCRLITFAGPMLAIEMFDLQPTTADSLWNLLFGDTPTLTATVDNNAWRTVSPGQVEGVLLGGCLSVISPLIGTPYCPDFKNAILLLEDVGEDLYKIDRLFSHLKNAGVLSRINGIILGSFVDLTPDSNNNPVEFDDIISYYCAPLNIPVISNFPYGHVTVKYTFPIGCRVRLDAENGTVEILEPGVT